MSLPPHRNTLGPILATALLLAPLGCGQPTGGYYERRDVTGEMEHGEARITYPVGSSPRGSRADEIDRSIDPAAP